MDYKFKIGDQVEIVQVRGDKDSMRYRLVGLKGIIKAYRDIKHIPLCKTEIESGDIAKYRVYTPHETTTYRGTSTFWEDELSLVSSRQTNQNMLL